MLSAESMPIKLGNAVALPAERRRLRETARGGRRGLQSYSSMTLSFISPGPCRYRRHFWLGRHRAQPGVSNELELNWT